MNRYPDVLADGRFGRDDGIKCSYCGGKTYLIDDQGHGYCSYTCEDCGQTFGVQFDAYLGSDDERDDEDAAYYWDDPNEAGP